MVDDIGLDLIKVRLGLPVAVPGVLLAVCAAALHTDRGHSLRSLLPPPAALPSLPLGGDVRIFRPGAYYVFI